MADLFDISMKMSTEIKFANTYTVLYCISSSVIYSVSIEITPFKMYVINIFIFTLIKYYDRNKKCSHYFVRYVHWIPLFERILHLLVGPNIALRSNNSLLRLCRNKQYPWNIPAMLDGVHVLDLTRRMSDFTILLLTLLSHYLLPILFFHGVFSLWYLSCSVLQFCILKVA